MLAVILHIFPLDAPHHRFASCDLGTHHRKIAHLTRGWVSFWILDYSSAALCWILKVNRRYGNQRSEFAPPLQHAEANFPISQRPYRAIPSWNCSFQRPSLSANVLIFVMETPVFARDSGPYYSQHVSLEWEFRLEILLWLVEPSIWAYLPRACRSSRGTRSVLILAGRLKSVRIWLFR